MTRKREAGPAVFPLRVGDEPRAVVDAHQVAGLGDCRFRVEEEQAGLGGIGAPADGNRREGYRVRVRQQLVPEEGRGRAGDLAHLDGLAELEAQGVMGLPQVDLGLEQDGPHLVEDGQVLRVIACRGPGRWK